MKETISEGIAGKRAEHERAIEVYRCDWRCGIFAFWLKFRFNSDLLIVFIFKGGVGGSHSWLFRNKLSDF